MRKVDMRGEQKYNNHINAKVEEEKKALIILLNQSGSQFDIVKNLSFNNQDNPKEAMEANREAENDIILGEKNGRHDIGGVKTYSGGKDVIMKARKVYMV